MAVVCFSWEDEIHAMPVNIGVDATSVWLRSNDGVKLEAACAGVRMAVCIHDSDVLEHAGWSVTVRGPAEVVPEGPLQPLLRQVRPWYTTARNAAWIRVSLDRLDGRELAPGPSPD